MTEYSFHLTTILSHITTVPNSRNSHIISEFFSLCEKSIGTSENYENQNPGILHILPVISSIE